MSQSSWPTPTRYTPDGETIPAALQPYVDESGRPAPALLILAGAGARRSGWAADAATSLATALGERDRRIVLADLCLDAPELHETIGIPNEEGIADVFMFGASLRRVARSVPGRKFYFAPVGAYIPDEADIFTHSRWDRLIQGFSDVHASLMVYAPADVPEAAALAERLGRVVMLAEPGEEAAVAEAVPEGCSIQSVLHPPERQEIPTEPIDPDWEPKEEELIRELAVLQEQERRRRRVSILVGLVVVLGLAVGGWAVYEDDWRTKLMDKISLIISQEAESAPVPDPVAEVEDPRPVESAVPFSVLIESHTDVTTATERVDALREAEPSTGFHIAPVLVDSIVYYRVLAGPAADSSSAWSLMRRLVEAGHKDEMQSVGVRRTTWAFDLGDFDSVDAAEARAEAVETQGVPVYTASVPYTAGPPRYRVYAGAFETREQAEVMRQLLDEAEIDAALVRRIGRPAP